MKKCLMFGVVAVLLSAISVGCSSDGSSSSWCRSGSLWPTARNRQDTQVVYATSGQVSGACDMASACNPCEPVCNPCDMSCTGSSVTYGPVTPTPHVQ